MLVKAKVGGIPTIVPCRREITMTTKMKQPHSFTSTDIYFCTGCGYVDS